MILAEAEINPNMIIVIVAVIIAAIKAFLEKKAELKNPPPFDEEMMSDYEELYEAYEAELEAQRRQVAAESTPVAPPPLPATKAEPVYAPGPKPAALPKVSTPKLTKAEQEALKRLESGNPPSGRKKNHLSTKARLKTHLASPTAAREALLLAEILGPPKALK